MTLYNDRVYAYERMQALDQLLDEEPTDANISQMIDDATRNHLAFLELQNYNDHKEFLYFHPLLQEYKLQNELDRLRKSNPERFMNELVNADKSITRYRSMINNNKYKDKTELRAWQAHINSFEQKLKIMQQLIAS